jgi:hypothetical protein
MLGAIVVCLHGFLCGIDGLADIFHYHFESLVRIQGTELLYVWTDKHVEFGLSEKI